MSGTAVKKLVPHGSRFRCPQCRWMNFARSKGEQIMVVSGNGTITCKKCGKEFGIPCFELQG